MKNKETWQINQEREQPKAKGKIGGDDMKKALNHAKNKRYIIIMIMLW